MDVTPIKLADDNSNCFLCGTRVENKREKVRIFGQSSLRIPDLIDSVLELNIKRLSSSTQLFVCSKTCYKRLERYKKCKISLETIKKEFSEEFDKTSKQQRTKRLRKDNGGGLNDRLEVAKELDFQPNSLPKAIKLTYSTYLGCTPINPSEFTTLPILSSTPKKEKLKTSHVKQSCENTTPVTVVVSYPSKTVRKRLPEELAYVGKVLSYGKVESVAVAITKSQTLMKEITKHILKGLAKEVSELCSTKNPSLLRNTSQEHLVNFDFESLCNEWKSRAPLFYSFLLTSSSIKSNVNTDKIIPSVAVAGSVLLKQRNRHMSATASVIGLMVKSGSIESTLGRLSKLKITCCNKVVLSKMDALGENFDKPLKSAQKMIEAQSIKKAELLANIKENVHSSEKVEELKEELESHLKSSHEGLVVGFDNTDMHLQRRNMTSTNQNTDIHWVNHNMFLNRVSGNLLPTDAPRRELIDVSNKDFLPSVQDQLLQRHNFAVLISRILVDHFDVFAPFKDACIYHIPHKYKVEMAQKSEKVPLGIIFKNENLNEDMVQILQQFQSYLPKLPNGEFDPQIVAGDQLSVERAVNVMSSVSNGYSAEERLEGMHLQLGDWHSGMKLLCLIFKRFYSAKSEIDICTLASDRALINRRNVKSDPEEAYRADRDFLDVVIKARVLTAASLVLGFDNKESQPKNLPLPKELNSLGKDGKLSYLMKAAYLIVDKLVFNDDSFDRLIDSVISNQQIQDTQNLQPRTVDGKFPCRFPGCHVSFVYDGASRRKHESAHNPPPAVPLTTPKRQTAKTSKPIRESQEDDTYNYNCALLLDGLLFFNFLDAVKEGDGMRLMRQYKYMLLYCKADGQGSPKYALECLYQSFLTEALLSPRDRERFIWNRSVNTSGGVGNNIAHDLELEHSNKFVKASIKNLGPNVNEKSVTRICQSEKAVRSILNNTDRSIYRQKRSGKHTRSSEAGDLNELVQRGIKENIFLKQPGRDYQHYHDFEIDPFKNLNMSSLYQWINKHKKNMELGIKAR